MILSMKFFTVFESNFKKKTTFNNVEVIFDGRFSDFQNI